MIYSNCQMSAKLENNSINAQLTTLHAKLNRLALSSNSPGSNVREESTQRLYFNRSSASRNLNEVFLKSTERIIGGTHLHSPVVLTQKSSTSFLRESSWKLVEETDQQAQEIQRIEVFLGREGLLQVFNSFEKFRGTMIESLSECQGSVTTRNKIDLLQAIANLKNQLNKLSSNEAPKGSCRIDMNFYADQSSEKAYIRDLLLQLASLRKDNDKLRLKVSSLASKLEGLEGNEHSYQHSIFNNSISFYGSSQGISEITESVEQSIEYTNINEGTYHMIDSVKLASKSTTLSLQNSRKVEERAQANINEQNILEEQSYQANSFQCSHISLNKQVQRQEAMTQTNDAVVAVCSHHKWFQLAGQFIAAIKKLFKYQFEATNLALRHSQFLNSLEDILRSYRTFKPTVLDQSQTNYISQCSKLLIFILQKAAELANFVKLEIRSFKTSNNS